MRIWNIFWMNHHMNYIWLIYIIHMIHIIQNIFQIIIESSSYNSMLEGIEHCSTELTITYHIISVGLPKERYVMVCLSSLLLLKWPVCDILHPWTSPSGHKTTEDVSIGQRSVSRWDLECTVRGWLIQFNDGCPFQKSDANIYIYIHVYIYIYIVCIYIYIYICIYIYTRVCVYNYILYLRWKQVNSMCFQFLHGFVQQ